MGALGIEIGLVSFDPCKPSSHNFIRNYRLSSLTLATTANISVPKLRVSNSRRLCAIVVCLNGENARIYFDSGPSTLNSEEARIDIGLPRRSLLVQFTCDACGERTARLINRVAYEKGTVFLQCDNLGLVVEYDLCGDQHDDIK